MGSPEYDFVIVGGGFFGCRVACFLKKQHGASVLILEKSSDILRRASFANQARVHNGYHYPRSILTAIRSVQNFPCFVEEFRECIVHDFKKIYAVAGLNSKVTAAQFYQFFKRLDSPIKPAAKEITNLFNLELIDGVFETKEFAFDSVKLAAVTRGQIEYLGVLLRTEHEVIQISRSHDAFDLTIRTPEVAAEKLRAKYVFNCTYSNLNHVLNLSGLQPIQLKHEITELALVEPPSVLKAIGVTLMDGPFFSLMPFPAEGLHSFSHVRYTPHSSWIDQEPPIDSSQILDLNQMRSRFRYMVQDAKRYLPAVEDCAYRKSLWEVKTVLRSSEMNDSRPILFKRDENQKNFYSVLGAKIDNIYDIELELEQQEF